MSAIPPIDPSRPRRAALAHERPLFFAHRGGSALAPENTLVAFENGVALGADALELDVHPARDGEIMVLHDPTVDRTTDGAGPIGQYTREELQRLDAGYRFTPDGGATYPYRGVGVTIPTLREVFERFMPAQRINIEMKSSTPESEARLWALIQEFEATERVIIGNFGLAPLMRFRTLSGGKVATSGSMPEIRDFVLAAYAHMTRALHPAFDALQVPVRYYGVRVVSRTTVEAAHRMGLDVHVWTVDDRAAMQRLLALGVDGLMSDRPDILADVRAPRTPNP